MKNKKKIVAIISGSGILFIVCALVILICVLMIFDFFGTKLTEEKVQNNEEYADSYIEVLNKYLTDGYVPLQRLLYFYLEDTTLSFDTLYSINLNTESKMAREIEVACEDQRVKNMTACTSSNIKENEDYLVVSTGHFNFPLKDEFTVTSYYNQERTVYGESNTHNGWDLAVPAETPVYSVCDGIVEEVNFTQEENIPYEQSGNSVGNTITIKCDEDYAETYYVIFAHLYPNSAKVTVGDIVSHWTEIASAGTTGHSTGNHLHYQVENENRELVDGMQLIDFTLSSPSDYNDFQNTTPGYKPTLGY